MLDMAMAFTFGNRRQDEGCQLRFEILRMTLQRWFAFPTFLTENKHASASKHLLASYMYKVTK